MNDIIIIGYGGHSYVVIDIILSNNSTVKAYCDIKSKSKNPYSLKYLGREDSDSAIKKIKTDNYFISIGDNKIREKVFKNIMKKTDKEPINIFHKSSVISDSVQLDSGIMVGANVIINPISRIGKGVICNSGAIIEHNCILGSFTHIAPGAVLAGGVTTGERCFIGANATIKENVVIGKDVIIGAGSVVLTDVEDNCTIVGNPAKKIN